jgi:predicted phosphodiesterase
MDRFAAIADIHGNLHALEAVLADIDRCHIRATVNLGDNLFGPLDPTGTADLLIRLNLPGMSLFHGTPRADTEYLLETVHAEDVTPATQNEIAERIGTTEPNSLFLCRHTHLPRTVAFGDSLIVNPGSVGLQAYQDDSPVPHVMETGSPHARLRHPGKKSQRLAC